MPFAYINIMLLKLVISDWVQCGDSTSTCLLQVSLHRDADGNHSIRTSSSKYGIWVDNLVSGEFMTTQYSPEMASSVPLDLDRTGDATSQIHLPSSTSLILPTPTAYLLPDQSC